jgi:hypothetical protein
MNSGSKSPAHLGFRTNNGYKTYPFRTHLYRVDNYSIFLDNLLSLNFQNDALFFQPQQGLKMTNDRPKTPFLKKERWGFVVYGVGIKRQATISARSRNF